MNQRQQRVFSLVFEMPDQFTVNDVVNAGNWTDENERFREDLSVFLERLVAMGILRQERQHYLFNEYLR
ncbi:MAG: hypothetical protein IT469_04545 [Pseudomonadales bacterium]|nr:hypothetical protein [Pseudomonadales bacterium]HMN15656.1 hypothetical protein [Bellilinea sp.]